MRLSPSPRCVSTRRGAWPLGAVDAAGGAVAPELGNPMRVGRRKKGTYIYIYIKKRNARGKERGKRNSRTLLILVGGWMCLSFSSSFSRRPLLPRASVLALAGAHGRQADGGEQVVGRFVAARAKKHPYPLPLGKGRERRKSISRPRLFHPRNETGRAGRDGKRAGPLSRFPSRWEYAKLSTGSWSFGHLCLYPSPQP